jgi:hypothetical protein
MEVEEMFPSVPPTTAEWAPVYLEPLHGSGERIVVAVVCVDANNRGASRVAASPRVWKCMYGEQAQRVAGLAALILESFEDHVAAKGTLGQWLLPSQNCSLGPIRLAHGITLEAIVEQGIRLTSSLSTPDELKSAIVEESAETSLVQVERFIQRVKEATLIRASEFEQRFNRTVSVVSGAEPTSIGYIGIEMAANFDVLMPGRHSLPRKRTRAKAKLLDLQALRDQVDLLGGRQSYELLLWVPPENSPQFSDADLKRSEQVFLELEEIADKHQLRVEKMFSAEDAAKRILFVEGVT